MVELIRHKEGGGVHPVAYFIDINIPWKMPIRQWFVRTLYDCKGRPFGRERTWWRFGFGIRIPFVLSYYTSFGSLRGEPLVNEGMIKDRRTIEDMVNRCCPPQFVNEILGTLAIPD